MINNDIINRTVMLVDELPSHSFKTGSEDTEDLCKVSVANQEVKIELAGQHSHGLRLIDITLSGSGNDENVALAEYYERVKVHSEDNEIIELSRFDGHVLNLGRAERRRILSGINNAIASLDREPALSR